MIRKIFFWTHLVVGLVTGVVVLVLCLTGALLVFEKQIFNLAERDARAIPPSETAERASPAVLLASAARVNPGKVVNIEWFADRRMPARLFFADRSLLLLNSWTGEVLGPGAASLRGFSRFITTLHVNLTMLRSGKWIVDVSNAAFVFLMLSGLWIWWPRQWRWKALRSSVAFRWDLRGKARDWNWHNALGFWFLTPLLVVAASGLVLSFKPVDLWWRGFAGKHMLSAAKPSAASPTPGSALPGWDSVMNAVQQHLPGWQSMIITNPAPQNTQGVVSFMVSMGAFGQRAQIHTVSVNQATNTIVKISTWENDEAGNRARAIARFGHTGEFFGPWGQTLALLACLAGMVLVYTGFALSWRRFFPRRKRAG